MCSICDLWSPVVRINYFICTISSETSQPFACTNMVHERKLFYFNKYCHNRIELDPRLNPLPTPCLN